MKLNLVTVWLFFPGQGQLEECPHNGQTTGSLQSVGEYARQPVGREMCPKLAWCSRCSEIVIKMSTMLQFQHRQLFLLYSIIQLYAYYLGHDAARIIFLLLISSSQRWWLTNRKIFSFFISWEYFFSNRNFSIFLILYLALHHQTCF